MLRRCINGDIVEKDNRRHSPGHHQIFLVFLSEANLVLVYEHVNIICISALTPANLTGHVERVGIENFELLRVLGTGGEYCYFCLFSFRDCAPVQKK